MIMLLFLLSSLLLIQHNQAKCSDKCKEITALYDDIQCTPLYENPNDCCPFNYDCSHLLNRSKTECVLQRTVYKVGQMVPYDEAYSACKYACRCGDRDSGQFTCGVVDCPEHLGKRSPINCPLTYMLNKCCAVGSICPPFDNLAKCEVDEKTYYEGQQFYPKNEKCLSCVCQKGFKGKFIEPFCQKINCLTELRNSAKIHGNCAVVYSSESGCCPYTFICPEDHAFTIKKAKAVPGKPICIFGQEILNIGDTFEKTETFSGFHTIHTIENKCECRVPPLVTCIEKDVLEKTPEHIEKSLHL